MKTARYRSREFALQAVYQWLVSKNQPALIALDMMQFRGFDKCDPLYFRDLLEGTVKSAEAIEKDLTLCLDRPLERLSPIERAILMIAGCELLTHPEVPYRVVINEAVELAKRFGGTDGYKYVNGVLDKMALIMRPIEVKALSGVD